MKLIYECLWWAMLVNNTSKNECVFLTSISMFVFLSDSKNLLKRPQQKYADTTGITINMVLVQKPFVSFLSILRIQIFFDNCI